ncbi:MAG: 2-isopropylmalate synthase [candidate division BRC1 bacterium ADurb.Bin183]|nr:MAG: 2-isopropylmalate synthase [candidate division BRC1 bacterium ADurb.Bin183]
MGRRVFLYDTTLRDGEQAEGISFSVPDKIRIAQEADNFGIDYVEGGWPGANPKADEFFAHMKSVKMKHARLAAFGSTRRKKIKPEDDSNLCALIASGAPVCTIFGKSWDLHVREALQATPEENLAMISDSVRFLKSKGREVIYDAEHFFDGFKNNPEYALKTILTAAEAGADCITLCDTNGGTLTFEYYDILAAVRKTLGSHPFGIHTHNDSGLAVANAITAVHLGASQVQGTMNGYGERCGNADLIQIIPALVLKANYQCVPKAKVRELKRLSRTIDEIANLVPNERQPYVGNSVFTHKGGIHVSAVLRNASTYEHIEPEAVGNKRRVLVSEMSGVSNLRFKADELGIDVAAAQDETKDVLRTIKDMENEGYQFEGAEASFEVMMKKAMGKHRKFFELVGFRVIVEKRGLEEECITEATIKIRIGDDVKIMAAEGDGPIHALDTALKGALNQHYPVLKKINLTDFKVRVVNPRAATAAKVRVMIETSDGKQVWGTVGLSENIIQASWQALLDSIDYVLLKEDEKKSKKAAR